MMAFETTAVQGALNVVRQRIGNRLTSAMLGGADVAARVGLQTFLVGRGVNLGLAEPIAESVGAIFDGLRIANYFGLQGKARNQALRRVVNAETERLRHMLGAAPFEQAVLELAMEDFRDLSERLDVMTAEQTETFAHYKRQLRGVRSIRHMLVRSRDTLTTPAPAERVTRMFAYLGRFYRPQVSAAQVVESGFAKLAGAVKAVAKQLDGILGSDTDNHRIAQDQRRVIQERHARRTRGER